MPYLINDSTLYEESSYSKYYRGNVLTLRQRADIQKFCTISDGGLLSTSQYDYDWFCTLDNNSSYESNLKNVSGPFRINKCTLEDHFYI